MALDPPSGTGPIAGVNLTPLIDIMLVLLLVTMVVGGTATSTVQVDLPPGRAKPGAAPSTPSPALEVTLNEVGALSLEGQGIDHESLVRVATRRVQRAPQTRVIIAAAAGARHDQVMKLLATLQRAGATDVSFRTLATGAAATREVAE